MRGTLSDQFRGKHPFFWVVVIAALYGMGACVFTGIMLYKYAGKAKDGYAWDEQLRIVNIYQGGPAEGKLQLGDTIVALNGVPTVSNSLSQKIREMLVGSVYTLEIERNGIHHRVELKLLLHPAPNTFFKWQKIISFSLVSLSFLLIAILAGLLKPSDLTVRLFFGAFYLVGLTNLPLGENAVLFNEAEKQALGFFAFLSGFFLSVPMLFHLFLSFPPGLPVSRFWQTMKWFFYTVGIGLQAVFNLGTALPSSVYSDLVPSFLFINLLAIILVVSRNYRLINEPHQQQRIKWIISSSLIGFVSSFLLLLFDWVIWPRLNDISGNAPVIIDRSLFYLSQVSLLSMPIAWAYAILKHRVLDISVVIRRSLRYLLASRGFVLIEALLAFAVLSFIFAGRLGAALDRFGSNTRTLVTILGTVLMVLGLQTVNRKIRPLIDRRFFRDAYDAQQILTELTSSLRATTNVNEVLELTTAKIQQALYAANVTIFLRNGQRDFQSAVSSDYLEREKLSQPVARELHLPNESYVVQRIHDSAQSAEIDWDDPYSPVATQMAAMANGIATAQQEFETLRALQTNLVLPLVAKDGLLGVLALGPRAGDLPYSREDKRMLMNVAGQTAMALENSRLIEQKIDLEAENERRAHELEEARQLQLSMLPKRVPQLPHLDIAAFMKTATEVGGDYYDFHVAEDGTLTIAVGDATGHGLKAGTLVTATKSLFNELNGSEAPADTLQRWSRALKRMNLRGLFMALTMVKLQANQLTIAAAGMPPILIYRAAEQRVEEILHKAMPLGSLAKYAYKQETVALASGDVVVLLSDGLPERFNAAGEMLGYETMHTILLRAATLSAADIIQQFERCGDEWAQGKVQDDDVTFVALKIR